MGRFRMFTDDELDTMESAFCNEGLLYLVDEVRTEKRSREKEKQVYADSGRKDWYTTLTDSRSSTSSTTYRTRF